MASAWLVTARVGVGGAVEAGFDVAERACEAADQIGAACRTPGVAAGGVGEEDEVAECGRPVAVPVGDVAVDVGRPRRSSARVRARPARCRSVASDRATLDGAGQRRGAEESAVDRSVGPDQGGEPAARAPRPRWAGRGGGRRRPRRGAPGGRPRGRAAVNRTARRRPERWVVERRSGHDDSSIGQVAGREPPPAAAPAPCGGVSRDARARHRFPRRCRVSPRCPAR